MDTVLIYSIPRTGSTNFIQTLSGFSKVVAFAELFHHEEIYPGHQNYNEFLAYLRQKNIESNLQDRKLRAKLRSDFDYSFNLLWDFVREQNKSVLTMKIFDLHLPANRLETLISRYKFPSILLQRRPIDAYVSNLKASAKKSFQYEDTTSVSISIDTERYLNWHQRATYYFTTLYTWHKKHAVDFIVTSYEELHNAESSTKELSQQIFQELGVSVGEYKVDLSLEKQNKSSIISDSVKNWDQFTQEITDFNAEETLYEHFIK